MHALKTEAIIGIFDWERQVKQTVIVDIEISADIRKAALSDAIEDTLNYKRVAKRVLAFVEESKFHLVETLAEHIAMLMLEEFGIAWVRISLSKPGAIRSSRDVGVVLERDRSDLETWRAHAAAAKADPIAPLPMPQRILLDRSLSWRQVATWPWRAAGSDRGGAGANRRGSRAGGFHRSQGLARLWREYRRGCAMRRGGDPVQTGAAVAQYLDEPCRGRGTRPRPHRGARHHGRRRQQFRAWVFRRSAGGGRAAAGPARPTIACRRCRPPDRWDTSRIWRTLPWC